MLEQMRLRHASIMNKPQAKFNDTVKLQFVQGFVKFLAENGIEGEDAIDCANCYMRKAINAWRDKIAPSAPSVIRTDLDQLETLSVEAMRLITADNEADCIAGEVEKFKKLGCQRVLP